MVDQLTKSLRKLPQRDRAVADQLINQLLSGNWQHLKIKKLRGVNDIFRARQGRLRVIWIQRGNKVIILDVDLRSDTTYRKY